MSAGSGATPYIFYVAVTPHSLYSARFTHTHTHTHTQPHSQAQSDCGDPVAFSDVTLLSLGRTMADLLQSPVTSCAPEPEPTSVLSVSAPLAVIDRELLHFFSSGQASEADSHLHIKQLFDSVDEAEIPFLSTSAIKSGSLPVNSLVRYRCLVQVRMTLCILLTECLPDHQIVVFRICSISNTTPAFIGPRRGNCCFPSIVTGSRHHYFPTMLLNICMIA